MKGLVKRVPMPLAGLMLALAAAGNLVQSYGELYRNILGTISAFLLILLLAKIITYPSGVKEELKNPVVASVFPTLTMGMMLLSTYAKPFAPKLAFGMWLISVAMHIGLMIKFTINYIVKFDIKKVFPSWFIVYVGIVVGSVTAPAFEMQTLGRIFFWAGIISYFILLPIVIKKVRLRTIPEPALATIAKFYPSFSAFTFPLVISAISIKLANGFLVNSGQTLAILRYIVKFEELVAILMVLYVLIKYVQFLTVAVKPETATVGK